MVGNRKRMRLSGLYVSFNFPAQHRMIFFSKNAPVSYLIKYSQIRELCSYLSNFSAILYFFSRHHSMLANNTKFIYGCMAQDPSINFYGGPF